MTDVEKRRKFIINIIYFALIIAIGLLIFRYAMGVCFPIIFALFVAMLLQKPKNFILKKTPLKKGFASTVCVISLLFIAVLVVSLIGVRAINEIRGFIDYVALRLQNIDEFIDTLETSIIGITGGLPEFLSGSLNEAVTTFFTQLRQALEGGDSSLAQDITGSLSGSFSLSWITTPLSGVITTAKQVPSILIAIVVTIVTCCFMTADYELITEFVLNQFPKEKQKDYIRGKTLLKSSLGKMGKAYLSIMFITFLEVSFGLFKLYRDYCNCHIDC